MSELPKLDNRNFDDLLNKVKFLAGQYTPEWNCDLSSNDFGVVFAKVFCSMTENTISRYNKTLYNYYLTFLNMLGTKLRPAAPASGMVVVKASNSEKGAYLERGTRLFASADTEEGMVIYETLDSLTAIDTDITSMYFTDGKTNFIGKVYEISKDNNDPDHAFKPFRIFDNVFVENLQSHEIYFEDETVFDMASTDVVIRFYNKLSAIAQAALPDIFSDASNVSWQYYNGKEWQIVDSVEKVENGVRIKFDDETKLTTVGGKKSRFIRCKFNQIPEKGISVSSINYITISKPLKARKLLYNETDLEENDFFPFEEEYNLYGRFAIGCDEAFTKKGARVSISADVQFVKIKTDMKVPGRKYKSLMNESDFTDMEPDDIKIESVKWEYWNGVGWAKLDTGKEGEEFFCAPKDSESVKRKVTFVCPADISSISIGSTNAYFIRARISKINKRFDFYSNYITPYVHDLKIEYEYDDPGHSFEDLIVISDLASSVVSLTGKGVNSLMKRRICECPAMYWCLSKPLIPGMIRLFIDIEEGIHRFNPHVKWEYLSRSYKGELEWKHIDVMDKTDNFAHSETVTMIGKNDFEKTTIFGSTGYFIRIVNPDSAYSDGSNISSRPIVKEIKFNSVRVIQKDTRPPEYFSIEKDFENKVCKLSHENVACVEVWIDELGHLSTNEQEEFLMMSREEVQPEYNRLGNLEKLWIKWKSVPNLVSCGMGERVYEVDYPKGEILFGDGRKGKIPPEQYNESIKVVYSVCNGKKGNIAAEEIKDFVDSIPRIEKVSNPSPILGGVDMETIDSAARRMFSQISGGNRIVSLGDFEESICFNDRNIYKVRCIAHVDESGNESLGTTSIAVLPRMYMQGYEKFQGIKNKIWNFMDEKAPATLSSSTRLRIFEVNYVETSVKLDVVINDFNFYQGVYSSIESRLKEFLDPIKGNFSGKGWDIGRFPRKELIYNYIKIVPNIKWIKNINIFTKLITPEGKKELDFEYVKTQKFVVPVFGTPEINIMVN